MARRSCGILPLFSVLDKRCQIRDDLTLKPLRPGGSVFGSNSLLCATHAFGNPLPEFVTTGGFPDVLSDVSLGGSVAGGRRLAEHQQQPHRRQSHSQQRASTRPLHSHFSEKPGIPAFSNASSSPRSSEGLGGFELFSEAAGEVKILRALQVEINQRTEKLEELARSKESLMEEEQRRFGELATDQGRLSELVLRIIRTSPAAAEKSSKPPSRSLDRELDEALEKAGIPGFSEK